MSAMSDSGTQTPKKRMVPVGDHIVFTDLPDGRVTAAFAPLDLVADGADKDAAAAAIVEQIKEAMNDEARKPRWEAFVDEFSVEVEDDPIPEESAEALHKLVELDPAEFETFLDTSKVPVLIDFWAIWCGPCLMMAPELVKVAERLEGRLEVRKINVDNAREISEQFEIKSIPTLVLFIDGGEIIRLIGAQPADAILQQLEPHLV